MSVNLTYFTSWAYDLSSGSYQLGPIVVINDGTVTVDGVAITDVMSVGPMASWSISFGNPSSAVLAFTFSSTFNAMTFIGSYWLGNIAPQGFNLFGFATQPSAPLSTWNGTYYCYETSGGSSQQLGNLVIDSPNVTFNGVPILNPIYTGLSSNGNDTNELAWFTSDGNADNVAISFFVSTSQSSDGVQLFNGNIWPDGSSRPEGAPSSVDNFFGTTQSAENAAVIEAAANMAQAGAQTAVNMAEIAAEDYAAPGADENDNGGDGAADDAEDDAADDAVDDAADDAGEEAGADLAEAGGA